MYRRIEDFVSDWKAEESATLKIFSNISDQAKSKKANENIRSMERLAWHITQTMTEMPARASIIEVDYLENEPIPATFDEIISVYKKCSEKLVKSIHTDWTDTGLMEEIEVYGQKWERREKYCLF